MGSLTPSQRARLAITALLLVAAANLYLLQDVAQLWRPDDSSGAEPAAYLAKLAPLQQLLPPDAQLGYINPSLHNDAASKRDLFLTRYALVPRCVVAGSEPPLVLVAGDAPADLVPAATLLSDVGNGLRLYRRSAAPR
jgi:hypothetical protein